MTFEVRHRRPAGARRWWALVARTLALVLALTVAAPGVGLAADLAFHAGGHHDRSQGPALDAPAAPRPSIPASRSTSIAAAIRRPASEATEIAPPAAPGRLRPGALAQGRPSVSPDRLPRPPRA